MITKQTIEVWPKKKLKISPKHLAFRIESDWKTGKRISLQDKFFFIERAKAMRQIAKKLKSEMPHRFPIKMSHVTTRAGKKVFKTGYHAIDVRKAYREIARELIPAGMDCRVSVLKLTVTGIVNTTQYQTTLTIKGS